MVWRWTIIPTLGMKCSQPGNKTFPRWEYILSLQYCGLKGIRDAY